MQIELWQAWLFGAMATSLAGPFRSDGNSVPGFIAGYIVSFVFCNWLLWPLVVVWYFINELRGE